MMTVKGLRDFLETVPEDRGVFIAHPSINRKVIPVEPFVLLEVDPRGDCPLVLGPATMEAVAIANSGKDEHGPPVSPGKALRVPGQGGLHPDGLGEGPLVFP